MEELREAVRVGDYAKIERLLAEGRVSLNERDDEGRTALMWATVRGDTAMVQFLILKCGASITEVCTAGFHVLHLAAMLGHTTLIQWLLEVFGASVKCKNNFGWTTLLVAARQGQYGTAHYMLEEGGASISETTNGGRSIWRLLKLEGADDAALSSLLKIMVLLSDAPDDFIAKLSPANAELCMRGRLLRAQLPSYLEQQRTLVVVHCPILTVLQPLVAAYAATTAEDMWTDGLRVQAPRAKRPRSAEVEAVVPAVVAIPRRSLRLRQKRA